MAKWSTDAVVILSEIFADLCDARNNGRLEARGDGGRKARSRDFVERARAALNFAASLHHVFPPSVHSPKPPLQLLCPSSSSLTTAPSPTTAPSVFATQATANTTIIRRKQYPLPLHLANYPTLSPWTPYKLQQSAALPLPSFELQLSCLLLLQVPIMCPAGPQDASRTCRRHLRTRPHRAYLLTARLCAHHRLSNDILYLLFRRMTTMCSPRLCRCHLPGGRIRLDANLACSLLMTPVHSSRLRLQLTLNP